MFYVCDVTSHCPVRLHWNGYSQEDGEYQQRSLAGTRRGSYSQRPYMKWAMRCMRSEHTIVAVTSGEWVDKGSRSESGWNLQPN